MIKEELEEIQRDGEGQTVEFKSSFAEQREGIQTMVAFANAQGGRVFFGVGNDGTVVGVDIGKNTLENLAGDIRDQTYPSLPVFIEEPFDYDGRKIVIVEVPKDVPPVVGVYLYSSDPIPLDQPVQPDKLQAFRRVGRRKQKEDFMRLRQPLPSDPRLRVALPSYVETMSPNTFQCVVWAEEGSATAHHITFRLDPDVGTSSRGYADRPLPFRPLNDREFYNRHTIKFAYDKQDLAQVKDIQVIASFLDDWGLEWDSTRRLCISSNQLEDGGGFSRRIVRFPPKRS